MNSQHYVCLLGGFLKHFWIHILINSWRYRPLNLVLIAGFTPLFVYDINQWIYSGIYENTNFTQIMPCVPFISSEVPKFAFSEKENKSFIQGTVMFHSHIGKLFQTGILSALWRNCDVIRWWRSLNSWSYMTEYICPRPSSWDSP